MVRDAVLSVPPTRVEDMEFATLADPADVEDGFNDAGAFTTMVLDMEPGPTMMSMLGSIDDSALDAAERTMVLQAWERQHAWLMVQTQKMVVAVAGLEAESSDDWVREEVACAVGLSSSAAGQRVHVARTLLSLFPATVAALERGELSWRHALAMVEFCGDFDSEHAAAIEQRLLAKAGGQTLAQFRRALKRAALVVAPEQARVRREKAVRDRDVQLIPGADGMASVVTTLPALEAVAAYDLIDAVAHEGDGATDDDGNRLGIDARRADAFVALLGLGGPLDSVGRSRVVRHIELQLVSDLPTWLALADNPVELLGYGHVPGAVVRQLRRDGADIALRRLIADPTTGQLLHFRAQDLPSAAWSSGIHPGPRSNVPVSRLRAGGEALRHRSRQGVGRGRRYLGRELWLPVSAPSQTEDARRVAASIPARRHGFVDQSGRSSVQRAAAASTRS
ncbi:MAG: hypothetical protein QOH29_2632 [Actinomycetota bacterium]|nr:hypothetical protein [Actinomycetota bacterium]